MPDAKLTDLSAYTTLALSDLVYVVADPGGTPTSKKMTVQEFFGDGLTLTGPVSLANGGSGANLTGSNGGIVYSGASALAVLAGTPVAGRILRSGASAAPAWSTATYPSASGSVNLALVSDGANFVSTAIVNSITGTANQVIASAATGAVTLSLPQSIHTAATVTFASLTAATHIGGTGTTSALVLRSTSGVGVAGADIIFQTGSNGATEAARILNNGNFGVGTSNPLQKMVISNGGAQGFEIAVGSAVTTQAYNRAGGAYINLEFDASNIYFMPQATGVGIGTTGPTARLHIQAGTATANTAPFKLTSGTNLTTAEAGAMEYDGTNLFFTRTGTTRESVICANAVNSVSPTAPNRTVTVIIAGTTYYLHAKTTND